MSARDGEVVHQSIYMFYYSSYIMHNVHENTSQIVTKIVQMFRPPTEAFVSE